MKIWPYKITLTIAIIFILSTLIFCFFPNNWDSFPIIISIFMPLFILFFKLEYDEEQKRIQKRLVSRNYYFPIKLSSIYLYEISPNTDL